MADTTPVAAPADSVKETILTPHEDLQISVLGEDGVLLEKGRGPEWIQALRQYRAEAQERTEISRAIKALVDIADLWAKDREWVRRVGFFFPKEGERTLSLVVQVPGEGVVSQDHMEVSRFGLAIGGVFRLIVEPRIVEGEISEPPPGWTLAYRKA
jgi:hypothetical protein